jgi:hypothetical protein
MHLYDELSATLVGGDARVLDYHENIMKPYTGTLQNGKKFLN